MDRLSLLCATVPSTQEPVARLQQASQEDSMGIGGGMLHSSRAARQLAGARQQGSLNHVVTAFVMSRRQLVGSGLAVAMAGAVAEAAMPSSSQVGRAL